MKKTQELLEQIFQLVKDLKNENQSLKQKIAELESVTKNSNEFESLKKEQEFTQQKANEILVFANQKVKETQEEKQQNSFQENQKESQAKNTENISLENQQNSFAEDVSNHSPSSANSNSATVNDSVSNLENENSNPSNPNIEATPDVPEDLEDDAMWDRLENIVNR